MCKGYVSPGETSGGQFGEMGGEHSHAVTGMIIVGPCVVAVLCFRLRLIVSLYSVND